LAGATAQLSDAHVVTVRRQPEPAPRCRGEHIDIGRSLYDSRDRAPHDERATTAHRFAIAVEFAHHRQRACALGWMSSHHCTKWKAARALAISNEVLLLQGELAPPRIGGLGLLPRAINRLCLPPGARQWSERHTDGTLPPPEPPSRDQLCESAPAPLRERTKTSQLAFTQRSISRRVVCRSQTPHKLQSSESLGSL
jgi:hypothetical protein